jgi:ubiquinone/menaquinone biosynthesis C-methylase UbiE
MSFDRLAPHYRWLEWVLAGRKLQRCRTAFLDEIGRADATLLVGEGNGRFLGELLKRPVQGPVTCIDKSARMLDCARARLRKQGLCTDAITFIQADILEWSPPRRRFDLIVTDFFLDCFQPRQLESVVSSLSDSAKPQARWLLADFQLPDGGWQKVRAAWILALMYWFFRWTTHLPARYLASPDALLAKSGFILQQRRRFEWGLLYSDLWIRSKLAGPC